MADALMLIAGLGNPGDKYRDTRHNLGFAAIDALAARWRVDAFQTKFKSETVQIAATTTKGAPALLLKPQTFMNLSGEAIAEAARFYKIPPSQVLVLADDLDTPAGTLRLRISGGAGGHNGLRSIISHLGTEEFPRLRIGIGRPPGIPGDVFVLAKIAAADRPLFENLAISSADAVEKCVVEGVARAMNTVNQRSDEK